MRKIILFMHISLDGYVAGPKGEMDWIELGDEMWNYVNSVTETCDTALYGATTFRMMESYWPNAGTKPDASQHDKDHSRWANSVQKIVFSKGELKTDWAGTRVIHDHVAEEMAMLKAMPGKNMLMLGSPTLARSFMNLGLIDEFCLNVNPVILGGGKSLYGDIHKNIPLKLIEEQRFSTGVIAARYELVRAS